MKKINDDIKNNTYEHIYLLYGEEDYLKKLMKDRLKKGIIGDDDMNYTLIDKKCDENEIISIGETLPFFSERKLIVLDNADIFSQVNERLNEFLKNIPDYLYMVIVEDKTDKRKNLFKIIDKNGYAVELKKQKLSDITKFIVVNCKESGKKIDEKGANEIIKRCGPNLGIIKNELEKLFSFTYEKDEITADDVIELCGVTPEDKVFDMISAIAVKDKKKTFELYKDLLALKEAPVKVFILLERQFMALYQIKTADMNVPKAELAKGIGLKGVAPFLINGYISQAKHYSEERLEGIIKDFVRTEEDIKTGRIKDQTGLELMIVNALQ